MRFKNDHDTIDNQKTGVWGVILNLLGVASILTFVVLLFLGLVDPYAFVFFFGHLLLYTFPVALPLLALMLFLAGRLIVRMVQATA